MKSLKPFGVIIPLLLFISFNLFSEDIITLNLGDRYRITERQNLRIRVDGRYKGYLYREYRGFLRRETDNPNHYSGEFYILEDLKRDSRLIAKAVDQIYTTEFLLNQSGYISIDAEYSVPLHQSFPAFSFDPVSSRDSWIASGFDLVSDSDGNFIRIPFICSYIYRDKSIYQDRPVTIIDAQYALRYKKNSLDGNNTEITGVQGSHKSEIILFNDAEGGIFIRTEVNQEIKYISGKVESAKGFILTWYDGISASEVTATEELIVQTLKDSDTVSIELEKRGNGLMLKMKNIHFLPDSPVILSEEKDRLDIIADLLKEAGGRTFLVVGHTADVGTKESQLALSRERAKTIVDELVVRGVQSKQFIYQGEGGNNPIATNTTPEGRARNRRVEITILD